VKIIGILGAVFESLNILTILLIYSKLKKTVGHQNKIISVSKSLLVALAIIFIVGGIIGTINVL